jgi:ABC-type antimicrobial peptide transport system permease subunit
VLAAVGIFGLTARMITARRKELGIRLALGAQQAAVTRTVMATEAVAVGVGIVAGLGLSFVGARWLESFLFGVSPRDPVAFVGAALSLALIGVMASYIPARRTGRIDPIETLRAE